jgi:hypothetical protein
LAAAFQDLRAGLRIGMEGPARDCRRPRREPGIANEAIPRKQNGQGSVAGWGAQEHGFEILDVLDPLTVQSQELIPHLQPGCFGWTMA